MTSFPSFTLYRADGACSRVPHILLRELGAPFTEVMMGFDMSANGLAPKDKSMTRDEYLENIHPDGMVPALQVDGKVIIEMTAVLTYIAALAEEHGRHGWLPSDTMQRAKAYEWISWLSGTIHSQAFTALWRPSKFSDDEAAHAGIQAKARLMVEGHYGRIEAKLAANEASGGTRGHAVGGDFTVVDVLVYLFWRWAKHVDLEKGMVERWPRFAEVARGVELLDSTKLAMQIEQQGLWFS
jgi:glutathione S-transferase